MAVAESSRVVGYARVSTNEQNTAAQVLAFERAGVSEVIEGIDPPSRTGQSWNVCWLSCDRVMSWSSTSSIAWPGLFPSV